MSDTTEQFEIPTRISPKLKALATWLGAPPSKISVWGDGSFTYTSAFCGQADFRVSKELIKHGKYCGSNGKWKIFLIRGSLLKNGKQ